MLPLCCTKLHFNEVTNLLLRDMWVYTNTECATMNTDCGFAVSSQDNHFFTTDDKKKNDATLANLPYG